MNNYAVKTISRPVKLNTVRIENIFQDSNPYIMQPIIKDYIYIESRVIIA
ncbi:MAG: hypothetical protein PHC34_14230 [Candidatus Gastranaerophilales bacterium]|nr:hypothetical protein [Candidatus Gastranaerophilales bacterium]